MLYLLITHIILYIGPGMGGGVIAAILGILTAFALSLIAIFWYPIKKIIRFVKSKLGK
jgi:hypothetical protein